MNNNTLKRKRKTRNKFVRRRSMKKKKTNKGGNRRNLTSITEISEDIQNVKLLNKKLKEALETIREQEQEIANLKFQLESLPQARAFNEDEITEGELIPQPIPQGAASVELQEESSPYTLGPTLWGRRRTRERRNR